MLVFLREETYHVKYLSLQKQKRNLLYLCVGQARTRTKKMSEHRCILHMPSNLQCRFEEFVSAAMKISRPPTAFPAVVCDKATLPRIRFAKTASANMWNNGPLVERTMSLWGS
jgi:hypothetical protein